MYQTSSGDKIWSGALGAVGDAAGRSGTVPVGYECHLGMGGGGWLMGKGTESYWFAGSAPGEVWGGGVTPAALRPWQDVGVSAGQFRRRSLSEEGSS